MNENDINEIKALGAEMPVEYIKNYLDHLDRDGLYQLILFLLVESTAKDVIISMASEWNKMYGPINTNFGVGLE